MKEGAAFVLARLGVCLVCLGLAVQPARADIIGNIVNEVMEQLLYGTWETPEPASAQDRRDIPADALDGVMSPPAGRRVEIDGEALLLAPGCRIFDRHNRSVLPATVRAPVAVRYTLDNYRHVKRVWLVASQ